MHEVSTPLGTMSVSFYNDDAYLHTYCKCDDGENILVSIVAKDTKSLDESVFTLAKQVLDSLDKHIEASSNYLLRACKKNPLEFGFMSETCSLPEPFVSDPGLTFWGGTMWSIRFSECTFPLCQEYGVAVNFDGSEIIGHDTLDDMEEEGE